MKKELIKGDQAKKWLDMILGIPQETANIEFKRLSGNKVVGKIAETIVAMVNTDGGSMFIGIDDPDKSQLKGRNRLFGIEEDIEKFDALMHRIADITPTLQWEQSVCYLIEDSVSGKTVANILINKAKKGFHAISKKVFVREGASNRTLSPQEIIDMSYAKGFLKADEELTKNIDFDLLDTEWFKRWCRARNLTGGVKEVLFKTGLAYRDNQKNILPTRAAVLLFAELPKSLLRTDYCAIRIFRYQGTEAKFNSTPNLIGPPINIEGPIVKLIKDSHQRVLDILANGVQAESGFVAQHEIPQRVIREAITNAVIHRDYHDKKDIAIRIYEDRVEVVSPGMFTYNITLDNIGRERAIDYRNALLVRHLLEFPDAPNMDVNEGVRVMFREMASHNLYPPTYSTWPTEDDLGLRYYVKLKLFKEKAPLAWNKVVDYLEQHDCIDNAQARAVTGIKQMATMSKMLSKWLHQGLIDKVANGNRAPRYTKYRLAVKRGFPKVK